MYGSALYGLGQCYYALGQLDKANSCFENAHTRLEHTDPVNTLLCSMSQALIDAKLGHREKALNNLNSDDSMLHLLPYEFTKVHCLRVQTYILLGKRESAIENYRAAKRICDRIELHPNSELCKLLAELEQMIR